MFFRHEDLLSVSTNSMYRRNTYFVRLILSSLFAGDSPSKQSSGIHFFRARLLQYYCRFLLGNSLPEDLKILWHRQYVRTAERRSVALEKRRHHPDALRSGMLLLHTPSVHVYVHNSPHTAIPPHTHRTEQTGMCGHGRRLDTTEEGYRERQSSRPGRVGGVRVGGRAAAAVAAAAAAANRQSKCYDGSLHLSKYP